MSHMKPPSPTTAASLLASGGWRFVHSWWLLAPILGFGIFGCVGFWYVASRVRTRASFVAVVLTTLACAATIATIEIAREEDAWPGFVILASWVGQVIYGVLLNRSYLRWRADKELQTAWYLQPAPVPGRHSTGQPAAAPTWVAGLTYNLNAATVTDVIVGSGLSEESAVWLLGARDARGGFTSFDQLAGVGLTPAELEQVRTTITFTD